MSGKKKNRNKVKRTGTGSQGGSVPVVDKTEVLVPSEAVELSNGNGEHVSTEAAEQVVAGDSSIVEVSQSSAEGTAPSDLNGESSDNGESSVAVETTSTDVHTPVDAAVQADPVEDSPSVEPASSEAVSEIPPESTQVPEVISENIEQNDSAPVASEESTPVVDAVVSDPVPSSEVVEESSEHKTHSRKSSSASSKSSKSSKSDHEAVSAVTVEEPAAESVVVEEPVEEVPVIDNQASIAEEIPVTSSVSDSIKTALLEAAAEDHESSPPRSRKSSASSASSEAKPIEKATLEASESQTSVASTNGHHHARMESNHSGSESQTVSQEPMSVSVEVESEVNEVKAVKEVEVEKPSTRASEGSSARTRGERRPLSRVSSSSSSFASSVSDEELKISSRAATISSVSVGTSERTPYKPLEPYVYNTSTSDDEDDEETRKATERAVERRGKAKARASAEKVEQELLDAQEMILSLKRRLAKSEGEVELARDATAAAQEDLGSVQLELDLLKKKYTDMVNFREESESDAKKWRQRADILQGELELSKFMERKLADTAKALKETREELEHAREASEAMEASVKAAEHDKEQLVHAHQRELASAKRAQEVTIAASEQQIVAEREKATEAIKFVKSKLKAQIRELEILLQDRRDDEGESRTDKRRLEREVRRLEEKLEAEASDRAAQARAAESNKRQTELLKDRVNKLTADKLDLETLVLQEKRKFDALNADYDRATATIRNLQAQLDSAKSEALSASSSRRSAKASPALAPASSSSAHNNDHSSSSSDSE